MVGFIEEVGMQHLLEGVAKELPSLLMFDVMNGGGDDDRC